MMKKKFKVEVDCAVCAQKVEDAVREIPHVENCSLSFMTQKLMIEAAEEYFEEILDAVETVGKRIEPDFSIERG